MLTVIVALSGALALSRNQLAEVSSGIEAERAQIKRERDRFHYLNVTDPANLAAVQIPQACASRIWQWRVHVPTEKKYRLRYAFNETASKPIPAKNSEGIELASGETALAVSFETVGGEWRLLISSYSEVAKSAHSCLIDSDSTEWIDAKRYLAISAGNSSRTSESDPGKPFVLLYLRRNVKQDGERVPWKDSPFGMKVWIEEAPIEE